MRGLLARCNYRRPAGPGAAVEVCFGTRPLLKSIESLLPSGSEEKQTVDVREGLTPLVAELVREFRPTMSHHTLNRYTAQRDILEKEIPLLVSNWNQTHTAWLTKATSDEVLCLAKLLVTSDCGTPSLDMSSCFSNKISSLCREINFINCHSRRVILDCLRIINTNSLDFSIGVLADEVFTSLAVMVEDDSPEAEVFANEITKTLGVESISSIELLQSSDLLDTIPLEGITELLKHLRQINCKLGCSILVQHINNWVKKPSSESLSEITLLSKMLSAFPYYGEAVEYTTSTCIAAKCVKILEKHRNAEGTNEHICPNDLVVITCALASLKIRVPQLLTLVAVALRPLLSKLSSSQVGALTYAYGRLNCYDKQLFSDIENYLLLCDDASARVVILTSMGMLNHTMSFDNILLSAIHVMDSWCNCDLSDPVIARGVAVQFQFLSSAVANLVASHESDSVVNLINAMSAHAVQLELLSNLSLDELSSVVKAFSTFSRIGEHQPNVVILFRNCSERVCQLLLSTPTSISEELLVQLIKHLCECDDLGDSLDNITSFFVSNFEILLQAVEGNRLVKSITELIQVVPENVSSSILQKIDLHIQQNQSWVSNLTCDSLACLFISPLNILKRGSSTSAAILLNESIHVDKVGSLTAASATVFLCSAVECRSPAVFFTDFNYMIKKPVMSEMSLWDRLSGAEQNFFQSLLETQGVVESDDQYSQPRSYILERRVTPGSNYQTLIQPDELSADTLTVCIRFEYLFFKMR